MERRQHTSPVHITGFDREARVRMLEAIDLVSGAGDQKYNEEWLQRLVFEHPQVLPVGELEPAFFPLYPVCMEVPMPAGYLDNLYVSENGGLTLVECKLWRNPQARREVVGQILDYAKDLSQWSYEDLESALAASGNRDGLFKTISESATGIDEAWFVDAVSKNLKRGRFLLLIVGDGIREGVENIANFLQGHAGLDFTFGLVELGLFHLPEDEGVLVQPRTLTRTYSIERAVITVERGEVEIAQRSGQEVTHKQAGKRTTISEEQFYEALDAVSPGLSARLKEFVEELSELEIVPWFGASSLNLHWSPEGNYKINFGYIRLDGRLDTSAANWGTNHIGHIEIGYQYQDELAAIIPGAAVEHYDRGGRKVVQGEESVHVLDALEVKEQWKDVIRAMKNRVIEVVG